MHRDCVDSRRLHSTLTYGKFASSPNRYRLLGGLFTVEISLAWLTDNDMAPLKGNAFEVLMQASKKRKLSPPSRFVICPAGCGKHILERDINAHLDKCMAETVDDHGPVVSQECGARVDNGEPVARSLHYPTIDNGYLAGVGGSNLTRKMSEDVNADEGANKDKDPKAVNEYDDPDGSSNPPYAPTQDPLHVDLNTKVTPDYLELKAQRPAGPNAFTRMMEQSRTISASQKDPLQLFLFMSESGTVTLSEGNSPSEEQLVSWSAVVQLKDRAHARAAQTADQPTEDKVRVDVLVATAIPPLMADASTVRLVKRHSRLSVPVLKSILQKSIRRRKPLPAVRVAMELADKSLGDLLRRLPVIMMEDSTLHPQLPFLVWCMMAHAKSYLLPPSVLTKVMQIVFEVASCQWSDRLPEEAPIPDSHLLSLNSLWRDLLPWALMVRAEYGGMTVDVRMLCQYAGIWHSRFQDGNVPEYEARRLLGDDCTEPAMLAWVDVPERIHERAHMVGSGRVGNICSTGVERLKQDDICLEGVDFHCSPVIDHLLSTAAVGILTDILVLAGEEIPAEGGERRTWLELFLKDCMWKFSSGINFRKRFASHEDDQRHKYEELWKDVVQKEATEFQQFYVKLRLSS